jgi:hypothetical protein
LKLLTSNGIVDSNIKSLKALNPGDISGPLVPGLVTKFFAGRDFNSDMVNLFENAAVSSYGLAMNISDINQGVPSATVNLIFDEFYSA